MKTKFRLLIVLLAVNLLLTALIIFLLQDNGKVPVTDVIETVYEVTNISAADILAVKVQNAQANYALMQNGPQIEMISSSHGEWDQTQLRAFLYAAGHISGSRKVDDETKFEALGKNQPRANITIFSVDGSEKIYQVLADNPLGESVYFYSEGDHAVYLVPREVAGLFLRSEKDFLSHSVFSLKTEADYADVQKIEVKLFSAGRDYTVEKTQRGYYLTAPVFLRLPNERVLNDLLASILRLYADEIVNTESELAAHGLDKPDMELLLTIKDKTETAVFRLDEKGTCLMAQPGSTVIYRLLADPVLMLMQDYTTLMGASLFSYKPSELADLTLSRGNQTAFISFSGTGGETTLSMEGKELSDEVAAKLMKAVNSIVPAGELSGSFSASSEISLKATFNSGFTESVKFIQIDTNLYAVAIGGKADFAANAASVNALLEVFNQLILSKGSAV